MKTLLLFRCFLICGAFFAALQMSFAQAQSQYEDVVYLKNGTVIHGIITEQIPNKSIKIQTRDGNLFAYSMDEIDKITKEQPQTSIPATEQTSHYKTTGFLDLIRAGVAGITSPYSSGIGESGVIFGSYLSPYFSVGGGIMGQTFSNGTGAPVFADARGYLNDGQFTPLLFLDIGYAPLFINGYTNNYGGFYLNIGAGMRLFINNSTALWLELGFQSQGSAEIVTNMTYINQTPWYYNTTQSITISSVALRVGVSF